MEDVIASIDQVTPAWLTNTLRQGGHLPAGQVRVISLRRVHDEQLDSISYFLDVSYASSSAATAPAQLMLKLPRAASDPAHVALVGDRENRMYRALAPYQHELPVIPCYAAAFDAHVPRYHLLLADLSQTHDQPASWQIGDYYITQTVDCLARFHAYWWEHPRLSDGMSTLPSVEELDAEARALQQAFPAFADLLGDRLNAADRRLFERTLEALPRLWAARARLQSQTLNHGDAHFWNFLYPLDPGTHHTCMLDWQSYHISPGVKDLAFTIVLRYPQRTPAHERVLVRRYHDALLAHGVTCYRWDTCWWDYRRLATEHLLYPLRLWLGNAPEEFWRLFITPALTGFRELQCTDVLEDATLS